MLGKPARHAQARQEIVAACWEAARQKGLASFSLKDVATAVGVQAPSLYAYFASKNAMYDAMFADGNRALLGRLRSIPAPSAARAGLLDGAREFVGFCLEDEIRYQLLFQRTVPGFRPSDESYALALEVVALMRDRFAALGIDSQAHLDLWTALVSGIAAQQLANEPGGERWVGQLESAVTMYADFALGTE